MLSVSLYTRTITESCGSVTKPIVGKLGGAMTVGAVSLDAPRLERIQPVAWWIAPTVPLLAAALAFAWTLHGECERGGQERDGLRLGPRLRPAGHLEYLGRAGLLFE